MSLMLQDVFICLKICFQTGCPLSQSAKASVGLQHPAGPLLCYVMPLSLDSLFPLLLPVHCSSYPKWYNRVYSAANPQVSLLNVLPSRASSLGFE